MYCPNCAAPIDGVKFCRSCGSNVSLVPQAMSGQPNSVSGVDEGGRRRHHWERVHGKKEASIEKAATNFFSGIGFLLAAMFIIFFSPPGVWWGWVFIFPAFALIGAGVGQFLQMKQQQSPPNNQFVPPSAAHHHQPNEQPPTISAPTTSELIKPSSVTEHTTRNLESRDGEEKEKNEAKEMNDQ